MKANVRYWTSILHEAERDLDAATTVAALKASASKLMDAKVQLKRLQGKGAPVAGDRGMEEHERKHHARGSHHLDGAGLAEIG